MIVRLVRRCTGCTATPFRARSNKLFNVAQSLEPFFKALSVKQVEGFMKEETICRTKIGFKRLTEESFAELVNASTQKTIVDLIK